MKQVSLVSMYGSKPLLMENLIKLLWERIKSSSLKKIFKPYQIYQIHGTIIGMEKLLGINNYYNINKWNDLRIKVEMDFNKLSNVISAHLPISIRFGGFDKSYIDFMSFGKKPYERSFQIQLSKGKVIIIGWPHEIGDFSNKRLWNLRKDLEVNCNIRHKYAKFEDNDFFMVLGDLKGINLFSEQEINKLKAEVFNLEGIIRKYLSLNPTDITITYEDIYIAQYEKETLQIDSTNMYKIKVLNNNDSFIKGLYEYKNGSKVIS